MVASQARVAARRSVVDARVERRRAQREREDQIAAVAIEVGVALASGREATAKAELAAGRALNRMLGMGLSVTEVIEWCAADLTAREVARLRGLADQAQPEAADEVKP